MDQNQYPPIIASAQPGQVPDGELVAYFENREQLQHAMKRLTEANFPMHTLFVVGRNITQVEYVGGKVTWPKVILSSALTGAGFGAFIGLVSAVLTGTSIMPHLFTAVPLGIIVWVATGLLSYSRARAKGGGTVAMQGQTIPGSLELRAHWQTVERARQILGMGQYRAQNASVPGAPGFSAPTGSAPAGSVPAGQPGPGAVQLDPNQPPADPTSFVGPEYKKDGSKAGSSFGLRIQDPEEYARAVRQEPAPQDHSERIQQIREEKNQKRFGIRIDDPAAYQETIRKAPERKDDE